MPFFPMMDERGAPNADALYINALLCSALYHVDQGPFEDYAAMAGGSLVAFFSDPATFQPDYGVMVAGDDVWVALDGTTNAAQWIGHAASQIWPSSDLLVPCPPSGHALAVGSFIIGLRMITNVLDQAIAPIGRGEVNITGHSYGAAAAHAYGRELANGIVRPTKINIMTFGEPRCYDGRPAASEPDWHARIIAKVHDAGEPQWNDVSVDPVTLAPPSKPTYFKLGKTTGIAKFLLALSWKHYGESWLLSSGGLLRGEAHLDYPIPSLSDFVLVSNIPYAALHFMDTSYLVLARENWRHSRRRPELVAFDKYYMAYTNEPAWPPSTLGPSVTAETLNTSYFGIIDGPVIDSERPDWEAISASGYFIPPSTPSALGSDVGMTMFKGSLIFNSIQGGWSESVQAVSTSETTTSMMAKMDQLMSLRCKLSNTASSPGCRNPILPFAIKVEDQLIAKDSLTKLEGSLTRTGYSTGANRDLVSNQNLNLQLGARINYIGGNPQESVDICHHGLPAFAYDTPVAGEQDLAGAMLRNLTPNGDWLARLYEMVTYMCTAGLGFRTIAGAWNVLNAPGPYSTPNFVYYNSTLQMVELQWTNAGVTPNPPFFPAGLATQQPPNWPNVNSQCRLQVRGWRDFPVLNGRWAAKVVVPQTGYAFALRILRKCRQPQTLSVPNVSPVAWATWFPGQHLLPLNTVPVGAPPQPNADAVRLSARFVLVESKKLGRNFGGQRGRQRNRPT